MEGELSTRGLFYPTAIHQLFTGIYFMELCLAGLFFLVRDAGGKASCTTQAVIMIVVTVLTAFFHYSLDHSRMRYWFSLQWLFKQQSGSKYKERPDLRYRGELSAAKPRILQDNPTQDEALMSSRPVLWIPKDALGIAEDEIHHVKRAYDSIWISNEGASLDERGKLNLCGPLPESSK